MNSQQKDYYSKSILALLIGCIIALLLVIIIDKSFGWLMEVEGDDSNFFPKSSDIDGLGWSIRDKDKKTFNKITGIYSLAKKKERNGETIYDVTYNFDSLFRRVVPSQPDREHEKFIIFFGGSQTFGEGLNDSETIPALVQKKASSYRVYNYAYSGYGPHQMLRKLETDTLKNEVTESHGIAFFQYFSFHVPRVLGTKSYVAWAGGAAPHYRSTSENEIEYAGSFSTGRFFKTYFYRLLGKSAIATYFNVDLPARLTDKHYDLVCNVMNKSRDVFITQYPTSRFVVILGMTNSSTDTFMKKCLERNNIEFIDTRMLYKEGNDLTFPHDGHFTPKATRIIAQQIAITLNR